MPISRQDNSLFEYLHPKIQTEIGSLFRSGHYTECARKIAIFVEEEVKELHKFEQLKTQRQAKEMFGLPLMQSAFSLPNHTIVIADQGTTSGQDTQKGYKEIFCGFITGIRNPLGHTVKKELDKQEAIYILFLASLLLYKIDNRIT